LHPLSKYTKDSATKRDAIRPSLRVADFGDFPEEDVARSGEGVFVKDVKKKSPECRAKTQAWQ
jgi:hypothetical protein